MSVNEGPRIVRGTPASKADFIGLVDGEVAAALQEDDAETLQDILLCTDAGKAQSILTRVIKAVGSIDKDNICTSLCKDPLPLEFALAVVEGAAFVEQTIVLASCIASYMKQYQVNNLAGAPSDSSRFVLLAVVVNELRHRFTTQWSVLKVPLASVPNMTLFSIADADSLMSNLQEFLVRVLPEFQVGGGIRDSRNGEGVKRLGQVHIVWGVRAARTWFGGECTRLARAYEPCQPRIYDTQCPRCLSLRIPEKLRTLSSYAVSGIRGRCN